jgi:hypothetical protein
LFASDDALPRRAPYFLGRPAFPPVLGKMSSLFFNLCVNHGGKEKHKLCP